MRNLKRVLSLALALVMVLGMMVITTSAADYTDAEEITYTEAVEVMSALGILKGNPDGTFAPKGTLTREQAAKILAYVCLGADADNYLTGSAAPFDDVAATKWSAKYVAYCKNLGIIAGVGDNKFNPAGTLTTVQFAKMLLVAVGIDGTYTGSGWENNVKTAAKDAGLDVITIDNSEITREEACELALAAMKVPTTVSGTYWKLTVSATESYKFETQNDALLYKVLLGDDAANARITGPHKDTSGSLLAEVYEVTYAPATDDFGRPGDAYSWGEGADAVEMFYADEYVAAFEGPVAEKDIFAASGAKGNDPITYTLIEDGSDAHGTFTADKEIKNVNNHAKWNAAGTGEGIKSELYKEVVGDTTYYTLVAVREYMGTVSVTDATEDDARYINVELDILSTGYESTKISANYETEEFEDDDRVLVTVTWSANGPKIQSIAYPEVVEGTPTKLANGVVTIAGTNYVKSQNSTASYTLGTEGKWFVDSFGNLIANVGAAPAAKPVYNYGYLIEYAAQEYDEGTGNLLEAGKTTEAVEKFKFVNAAGETVVLDGALKVTENDDGSFTTDFAADAWAVLDEEGKASVTTKQLFRYELDKDGKISKIATYSAKSGSEYTVKKGSATLAGSSVPMTAETVYFYVNAQNKVSVYTGYNNIPNSTTGNLAYMVTADSVMAAMVLTSASVYTAPQTNYVYFAGTDYTEEWDAEAEDTVFVYENIYINGVKAEEGLKFAEAQTVSAGTIYAYTVNATTGLATKGDVLVDTTGDGTKATLVQETYFKAGSNVYTDEDTVFWQVNKTAKTIEVVTAMPASTQTQNTMVLTVAGGADAEHPATLVVFYTAKVSG